MAELVDASVSKTDDESRVGSIPTLGTRIQLIMHLDKNIAKETVFGVCFFSVLYELAIQLNILGERSYLNVITKLDTYYPTINIFMVPYFFYFLHIFISPYFIGCKDKDLLHRYTTKLVISSTIGFFIFLLIPTCIDRSMFEKDLYSFLYKFDRYGNVCPSFHVVVTWVIWINFMQLKISHKLMNACRILTYSIVASTVLIRQHSIIDIPVSIMIVEGVSWLTDKYNLETRLFSFLETKYFRYIKRMFYAILIVITIFLTICFSFVIKYYWKALFFKENIKEVYVSDIPQEHKPKVSIVIPVYNMEKYLKECMDSVVNQTMTEIEIICINDGSTDGSLNILKEYAVEDNRIKIIDKKNSGLGPSRNLGLDYVSGECVMFIDSDDRLKPNACEKAYESIKNNNSDIVSFGWQVFTDSNKLLYKKLSKDYKLVNSNVSFKNKDWRQALKTDHPYSWNKIYKADFLKHYRFLKTKFFAEEVDMTYKLFKCCNNITLIEDVLYEHRISDNNLSLKRDIGTLLLAWNSFAVCIFDLMVNHSFGLAEISFFYKTHLKRYNWEIAH